MAGILLVEDEAPIRRMLERTLERAGHVVVAVEDGRKALAALQAATIDLVLTDIVMPELEGLEAINRIRQLRPDMPIIAMSGGGWGKAGDYLRSARLLGATRTLQKPFTSNELLQIVDEALRGAGPDAGP